ncbi:uncharacterized protein LOC130360962 [Hyla sarda]|uniref:uncharacterized protein LOC130360962 n=1 Tax=Hyla sarda TaxID=327740 RepID=UPI0024C2A353|nr:uncharacterized protein LOC130360962 [Hyla sarda]
MQNPENSTLTVNPQCSYKEEDTLPRSRSRCTTLSRASSQTNLTSVSADASRFKRHSSRHSSTTSLSSASAIATKARAKAEAACAMASYAKQEAELMKEQAKSESEALRRKAEVQASLHLLQQQKNAAAALAEAEVLTRAAEAQFADIETQMSPLSASQRTREYIQSQATMYTDQQFNDTPRPSLTPPAISNFDTMQYCKTELEPQGRKSSGCMLRDQSANLTRVQTDADLLPPQANTSLDYSRKTCNRGEQSRLSQVPHQPYQPQPYPEFTPRKYSPDAARATEVARFLMRREIVSAGLMKFDDRPENYWAWKSSFLSGTQDLDLTDREKLDLLVKWLGPESTEQTQRIKSVHVHDATAGLAMNGRTSCLCPCTNSLHIKERLVNPTYHQSIQRCMEDLASIGDTDELGCKVFERTRDDDKPAPSVEDTLFLEIMDREVPSSTEGYKRWFNCKGSQFGISLFDMPVLSDYLSEILDIGLCSNEKTARVNPPFLPIPLLNTSSSLSFTLALEKASCIICSL